MNTRLARTVGRSAAALGLAATAALVPVGVASAAAPSATAPPAAATPAAATAAAPVAPAPAAATPSAATPSENPLPSSCRPANLRAIIHPAPASAGHRHYTVVLSAAPGTSPCTLQGSPSDLQFSLNGSPRASEVAMPYGDQTRPVEFGPGEPVQFDVQIRDSQGPAQANELAFTPHAPGGVIPGSFVAEGPIGVDAGIQVGPITER